jgi:hypothetical protein
MEPSVKVGEWVRLPPTLSQAAGEYRIAAIVGNRVQLVSRKGVRRVEAQDRLSSLIERATPRPTSPVATGSFSRDEGVLSSLGYHVGATAGLPPASRQIVLRRVFDMPATQLPVGQDQGYRAEWGDRCSEKRLSKMMRCLESFISLHLGRGVQYRRSISEWREDLQWLDAELRAPNGFTCYPMWFPRTS